MANAKMALASARRDGTDGTAHYRAVKMDVLVTANARWKMANIDVSASKAGLELIALLHWR